MGVQGAQPGWVGVLRTVFQIAVPVFFVLTSVRLLLTPGFVRFEYALPGFPADPYGFTKQDRIKNADHALEYLLNDAGIEFLGDVTFEDGAPFYNSRELRHMSDVKQVTQSALRVWVGAGLLSVALAVLLWRAAGLGTLAPAMAGAGKAAVVAMLVLIVVLVVGFSVLFVGFHRVFFEGETWIFQYSDSLIRMFPERFWQVAFGTIGVATMVQGGALFAIARWLQNRLG